MKGNVYNTIVRTSNAVWPGNQEIRWQYCVEEDMLEQGVPTRYVEEW